jgi:succinate dehydrogenase/fumarate reductase flavoprotein subunit
MNAMETKAPGFFLAGNYRDGISLADSIVSGSTVAERVAKHLARSPGHQIMGSAFSDKSSARNYIQEVIA